MIVVAISREIRERERMRKGRDEAPAVRVYTVSDESRYLIVRNIPALKCIDELVKPFGSYGEISEYRLMEEEDRELFTEVCWIEFLQVSNARFAKRKLDEYALYGNRLQVSYAPRYEMVSDTKEKLEGQRKDVLSRLNSGFLILGNTSSQRLKLARKRLLGPCCLQHNRETISKKTLFKGIQINK